MAFEVPDVCTLPTAERPLRLAEFDALLATAVGGIVAVSATHARVTLARPEATVRDLVARETACCSFITFTVTPRPADGTVVLDIEVPAAYAAVLAALVGAGRG